MRREETDRERETERESTDKEKRSGRIEEEEVCGLGPLSPAFSIHFFGYMLITLGVHPLVTPNTGK
jgi:hypothetical protein